MTDDELIEAMARAICFERAGPACDCKKRGKLCLAPAENLLSKHTEISHQARAALTIAEPVIRARAMEEAAKAVDHSLCDVAENCELFMAHRDYFAAAIRALAEEKKA